MHCHIERLQGKLGQVQPPGPAVRRCEHDPAERQQRYLREWVLYADTPPRLNLLVIYQA